MFTPVLNGQEVGILGVGRSVKELAVKDDNSTAIRKMAYFSLLYDHRIIDGVLASRFFGSLAEVIENESLLKEVLKM
jgi:pyruvate/2-oxoglutarate dehydrogenase complex dihydrolipoamide acyltransferase (E2) component